MIADLRVSAASLEAYGTWQEHVSVSPNGALVLGSKGADGKGGIGKALNPTLDLSRDVFIEVAVGVGQKNTLPEFTVAFSDVEQVQYTALIRVDQIVPGQPLWLRVRRSDFKLNDWQHRNTGRAIDWKRIAHWDLQGDWKTEDAAHFVFIALRARGP